MARKAGDAQVAHRCVIPERGNTEFDHPDTWPLYVGLESNTFVAEQFGLDRTTVSRMAAWVDMRAKDHPLQYIDWWARRHQGTSEIAAAADVSRRTVWLWRKQHGLRRWPKTSIKTPPRTTADRDLLDMLAATVYVTVEDVARHFGVRAGKLRELAQEYDFREEGARGHFSLCEMLPALAHTPDTTLMDLYPETPILDIVQLRTRLQIPWCANGVDLVAHAVKVWKSFPRLSIEQVAKTRGWHIEFARLVRSMV